MRELHNRAAKIRQPVNGTFELTERCNLSCRMCYVCQAADNKKKIKQELPAGRWVELARRAVDSGMVFLLLTGGEIFLRPDFFDIFYPLTRMGLILTLFTNGTLITESIAARLAEAPPNRTEITIYGATAKTYETITRVPGSYEQCIRGIEALVNHNIPLGLKSVLTRYNVHELETMRGLARGWDLPFSASWLITQRRDRKKKLYDVDDCRIPVEECIALESSDRASASEWIETARRESHISNDNNFYCQAGRASFFINSRGEMSPCIDLIPPAARPLDIGFKSAWEDVQHFVDNAPPLAQICMDCDARIFCPRCPAWSELETGTLDGPVPYLCEIAHARKVNYENKV